jgi:GT2 family glycosyltransferase
LKGGASGASGETLPNANASRTEKLFNTVAVLPNLKAVREVTKPEMGLLATNCAVISRTAWQELGGFDEAFAGGGEDTDLARRMLEAGHRVMRDPALSVHHTHGLGPINSLRQVVHWAHILRGPNEFDAKKLARRRPDLNLSAEG